MVINVTSESFEQEVLRAELPVLLDCYADWCGPCKMMAPVVDKMAEKYEGRIKVCKLNVDEGRDVARTYRVVSIPNFLMFKNGELVKNIVGAMDPDAFENEISVLLA